MLSIYQLHLTSVKLKISAPANGRQMAIGITCNIMDAMNPKRQNKGRNYVRQWRKYRKLTQERLAEALDCKPGDLISGPPEEINFLHDLRELKPEQRDEVIGLLNDTLARLKRMTMK